MKYWVLKIKRPIGTEETFDLRYQKLIRVGDHTANDVCIETVKTPSQLPMVKMGWNGPQVKITDELAAQFDGEFEKIKDWKTRLYQGSLLKITGNCSWFVEGTQFKLESVEKLSLGKSTLNQDPKVLKHALQSIFYSLGSHISILLLVLGFHFLVTQISSDEKQIEVQKISLKQMDELFKKPEPEPSQNAKEASNGLEETNIDKNGPSAPSAASSGNDQEMKRKGLGLLALQTAKPSAERAVRIDRPGLAKDSMTAIADSGTGFQSLSAGIRTENDVRPVAVLAGISGGSYQGGEIGDQIKTAANKTQRVELMRKEIEIRGGLDASIIQQIVEERLSEVRYCYENALLSNPNLSGKVETSWTIQADGNVSNLVSRSEDVMASNLHNCIKERIVLWKFPQPKGGGVVHVKYPFVFSSLGS
ncbi:MAG: AgmX/PglI C-terminal domain-containing protein [Bdellovibrionota bacterium]